MTNLGELDVWEGDWGLPSNEHRCLAVMAYCRFSNMPIKFNKSNNPWKSPSGELPVLRHDTEAITRLSEIFNYFRKANFGSDFELTTKQSADIIAYMAMLEQKLVPALMHLWWVDSKTYKEFSRPCFSKLLTFPYTFFYPMKQHKDSETHLNHLRGNDTLTHEEMETKIYKDAKECLNNLSTALGKKEYFFGTSPTSLDALVFGHLAPLLKATFPNPTLQNHLKGCDNLCSFCNRILNRYFPLDPAEEAELRKKREEEKAQAADEANEFPHRKRNMFLSGLVALSAMIGYAFLTGLVSIELTDNGNTEDSAAQPPNFNQFDEFFEEGQDKKGQSQDHENK